MTLLLQLLLAHFTGDFLLQWQQWIADKEKNKWRSIYLYVALLSAWVTGTFSHNRMEILETGCNHCYNYTLSSTESNFSFRRKLPANLVLL